MIVGEYWNMKWLVCQVLSFQVLTETWWPGEHCINGGFVQYCWHLSALYSHFSLIDMMHLVWRCIDAYLLYGLASEQCGSLKPLQIDGSGVDHTCLPPQPPTTVNAIRIKIGLCLWRSVCDLYGGQYATSTYMLHVFHVWPQYLTWHGGVCMLACVSYPSCQHTTIMKWTQINFQPLAGERPLLSMWCYWITCQYHSMPSHSATLKIILTAWQIVI